METAALLDVGGPWVSILTLFFSSWRPINIMSQVSDFFLRERDQGVMANISKKDRMEKFANEVEKRDQDTFYFSPPGYSTLFSPYLQHLSELKIVVENLLQMRVCE